MVFLAHSLLGVAVPCGGQQRKAMGPAQTWAEMIACAPEMPALPPWSCGIATPPAPSGDTTRCHHDPLSSLLFSRSYFTRFSTDRAAW